MKSKKQKQEEALSRWHKRLIQVRKYLHDATSESQIESLKRSVEVAEREIRALEKKGVQVRAN